ncbi:putative DNA-binding transcriptional regulator AlpA [Phyllobacterium trifolii]|uniref:Putative DNA-binding transcriptional regulator AlpA n=1 Tax=Phyllobacterium trifolii TaxID=300193 RepID=A0A839UCM7_9HYPH|nr:hypothetical protein [Phyllobacterium trifolii]MBB3148768.1 putative DNA-binding transcriptional regulator AlpA [Phyllobacterium trifolii]
MNPLDFLRRKTFAAELAVSVSQTYVLQDTDPDFPPPVYPTPNTPRWTRGAAETYKKKVIARQRPGAPRRGRPPKGTARAG